LLSGGKFKTDNNKNILIIKLKTNMDKDKTIQTLSKTAVSVSAFLTGKAKEDFKKWYQNRLSVMTYSEILNINDQTVYASLIVEWFDTAGYFIEITKDNEYIDTHVNGQWISGNYKNRTEAVKFTIGIVNEMYNENVV
jgi:hypothetical protein